MGTAYLAPYGVGLGHASRLVMVADRLKGEGFDIRFSSFGEAARYVTMHGYPCVSVSPVEFAWNTEGGFSVKDSLANIPAWFTNLSRQVNQEIRNMMSTSPDVVVSDSRLSPILAARILRIPSVVVLNQIKLLLSPRLRELAISRVFESIIGECLGSMWALADRILVPDLPPPYTISAHNVWDTGSASPNVEYVGFASPNKEITKQATQELAQELGIDGARPLVYIHVSGPEPTRMALVNMGIRAAERLQEKFHFVVSEGRTGGRTEPSRLGSYGWYYEWCPVRDEIFTLCDLAVLRGGHVTLSQAIGFGKPMVTVPIDNHGEQLGNSSALEAMGLGKMVHPKKLTPETLASAIEDVASNGKYAENARRLQQVSQGMNGVDNIVQIVRSYL